MISIYPNMDQTVERKNIAYYRVSSSSQKADLINQRQALEMFCRAQGLAISDWLFDIGSGLNYRRKNFCNLLDAVERGEIDNIVIVHKDRLVRFGYEWFEDFCKAHNTHIIVMNQESLSPEEEMVKDLMTIIHCFSSRLYGLRKYKKVIKNAANQKD